MLSLPIETVAFDLDGTLRQTVPTFDEAQFQLANDLDAGVPPASRVIGKRWTHYYWAQSPELLEDLNRFTEMGDDFWIHYSNRYLRALNLPERRAADLASGLFAAMKTGFKPENRLLPHVPETLQTIKDRGYILGLVSNRSHPCQEECEQLGLLHYFDFAYVAAEVNAWKPDPRIFERALSLSGSTPDRTLYVGDNYYADVIGARNAGLQVVLIDKEAIFPEANCVTIRCVEALIEMLPEASHG
jgi:HAD superfamily hydrolase (TIGR01509 family)